MYSTVLNPSHITRIRWQAALTVVITTLLLLLVSEKPGTAQVFVSGVIPGFGTVTSYRNEPNFFQLQIKGGQWPPNLDSRQVATISFFGPWTGSVQFEGDWTFTGARLFSFSDLQHNTGPLLGNSFHYPYSGPEEWLRNQHGTESEYDYQHYQLGVRAFGIPPVFIMNYTWTLSVYHVDVNANGAPEPGTLCLTGVGLILLGLVVRRRYK